MAPAVTLGEFFLSASTSIHSAWETPANAGPDRPLFHNHTSRIQNRPGYNKDIHFAWCTHVFDGRERSDLDPGVPPTSSPYEIYLGLQQEVRRGDRHSAKIRENRAGILRGAATKLKTGVIGKLQEEEIGAIVQAADLSYFKLMILVIPFATVQDLIQPVPVQERAGLFSTEMIIPSLPRSLFDVIQP